MNTKAFALAGAVALAATPALAVDLTNEDAVSYEVMIDDGNEVRNVTIKAGELIANICDQCVISVGDATIEAEGTEVAFIKDGDLELK